MRSRKLLIRILILASVLVVIAVAIIMSVGTGPGPDSPQWCLARATEKAWSFEQYDYDLYCDIVRAYGKLGDVKGAERAVDIYLNPDRKSWLRETFDTILIKMRLKPEPLPVGLMAVSFARPVYYLEKGFIRAREGIWHVLAQVRANAGDPAGAKACAAAVDDSYVRSHIYCVAADSFASLGDDRSFRECIQLAKADAAAEAAAGITKQQYFTTVRTLAEAGKTDEAQSVAAEAFAEEDDTTIWYGYIVRAGASEAFTEENAITTACEIIVRALDARRDTEGLRKYIDFAKSESKSTEAASWKASLLRTIAGGLARAGDVEGAIALARSTPDNTDLYAEIVKVLTQEGNLSDAEAVAAAINDADARSKAYCCVGDAQAKAGDVDGTERSARAILQALDRCAIYERLATFHANRGDKARYEEAVRRAAGAADEAPEDWVYPHLAETCAQNGDMTNFREFIRRAKARADSIERDDDARSSAYRCTVDALAKAGALDEAMAVAQSIPLSFPKDRAYASIATEYIAARNLEAALSIAKSISTPAPRNASYFEIAKVQATAGTLDDAQVTLTAIHDDELMLREAYAAIGYAAAKAGRLRELRSWIETLKDSLHRSRVCLGAAQGLIEKQAEEKKAQAEAQK